MESIKLAPPVSQSLEKIAVSPLMYVKLEANSSVTATKINKLVSFTE